MNSRRTIRGLRDSFCARTFWQGYRISPGEQGVRQQIPRVTAMRALSARHVAIREYSYLLIPVAKAQSGSDLDRSPKRRAPKAPSLATIKSAYRLNGFCVGCWTATPLEDIANPRKPSSDGGKRMTARRPISMVCPRTQKGTRLRSQNSNFPFDYHDL